MEYREGEGGSKSSIMTSAVRNVCFMFITYQDYLFLRYMFMYTGIT